MASALKSVFIVALVAIANGQETEPTTAAAKAEQHAKLAAVNKVVGLLTSLKQKTEDEGVKEAETYAKFCTFCTENSGVKSGAVQSGSDAEGRIAAAISEDEANRIASEETMAELTGDIDKEEKAITTLDTNRKAEVKTYGVNSADIGNAIRGLHKVIEDMKAQRGLLGSTSAPAKTDFLQLPEDMKDSIERSALMADALGLANPVVSSLLQAVKGDVQSSLLQQGKGSTQPFGFHAGDIITALENLEKQFKLQQTGENGLDPTEGTNKGTFVQALSTDEKIVTDKTGDLAAEKITHADILARIGVARSDLEGVRAQLANDRQYLQELTKSCKDKQTTFDQRHKLRVNELVALTTALDIVNGVVKKSTSKATMRLIQNKFLARRAHFALRSKEALEVAEAEAEQVELSLLQERSRTSPLAVHMETRELQYELDHPERSARVEKHVAVEQAVPENSRKHKVMMLLRSKAKALKSAMLTSFAEKVDADPLAQTKKLLQDLTERLLQQATNEAGQKGWCDKSIGEAEQKRDYSAREVASLNANMAQLETRIDMLTQNLATLASEKTSLAKALSDAGDTRRAEQQESANTIADANLGLGALQEAMTVLDRFYKTAAKEAVTLEGDTPGASGSVDEIKQSVLGYKSAQQIEEMDSGIVTGDAYTGQQSAATGIIGMLEVIEGDFKRTITQTAAAERRSSDMFLEFSTATQSSLAQGAVSTTLKYAAKGEAVEKLDTARESLKTQTDLLKGAISELLQLQPTCIDTGKSQKDRAESRVNEVEALKDALRLLEGESEE